MVQAGIPCVPPECRAHKPNEDSMTEEQDRRRLGHIHDFIMRTICEVEVGRSFLYAVEMDGGEGKPERNRTFELMVCYYLFLALHLSWWVVSAGS